MFSGCAKDVVLYPIEGSDIVLLSEGQEFKAPKQGAFLSDFYIEKVAETKVKHG